MMSNTTLQSIKTFQSEPITFTYEVKIVFVGQSAYIVNQSLLVAKYNDGSARNF